MNNVNLQIAVKSAVNDYLNILDGEIPGTGIYKIIMSEIERELFHCVFEQCRRNQTLATKTLGISRATFRKKMMDFGYIKSNN